jgi:hypothetical protein
MTSLSLKASASTTTTFEAASGKNDLPKSFNQGHSMGQRYRAHKLYTYK